MPLHDLFSKESSPKSQLSQTPSQNSQQNQQTLQRLPSNDSGDYGLENPTNMALSNLRCPSPPPILNKPQSASIQRVLSDDSSVNTFAAAAAVARSDSPELSDFPEYNSSNIPKPNGAEGAEEQQKRATIPAGGALLRGRAAATAVVAAVAAATAREKNSNGHQKSDSVHAHFYIDDTIKHGNQRSRSTSISNDNRSAKEYVNDQKALGLGGGVSAGTGAGGPAGGLGALNTQTGERSVDGGGNGHSTSGTTISQAANLEPRLPQDDGKFHILLGSTGDRKSVV